jgi:hypothetical protein
MARAHTMLEMSISEGGAGLTPLSAKAAPTYWDSVGACRDEPRLMEFSTHIIPHLEKARASIVKTMHRGFTTHNHPGLQLLPTIEDHLANGRPHLKKQKNKRKSAKYTRWTLQGHKAQLLLTALNRLDTNTINPSDLTSGDAVHVIEVLTRSQASRIFNSCLFHPINRIPAPEFRSYVRYLYNMPQQHRHLAIQNGAWRFRTS